MITINDRLIGSIDAVNVANDKEVIRLDFKCKNQVTELLKLTDCDAVYINYQNGSVKDRYLVTDLTADGEWVTFSWLLGKNATRAHGKTFFIVCAQITESDEIVQEWNTELAFFDVRKGLETVTAPSEPLEDIFTQLVEMINAKLEPSNIKAGQNVTVAVSGNDVTISATGGSGDAYTKAETDALLSNKQDKGDYATATELGAEETARQEADASLQLQINAKADAATTYNKTETDALLNAKADTSALADYATTAAMNTALAAKVDTNQGAANVGKVMTVGADGSLSPQTAQGGTTDYADLDNKPSINSVVLNGNKTGADLGLFDAPMFFTNVSATFTANSDTGYEDYFYKAVLTCTGVTASMLATVIFSEAQAASGNYALTCVTGTDSVTIYSNDNTAITIPTVIAGAPVEVETEYNAKHTYSTNEQVVGTWVDGKPLYEKTLHFSNVVAGGSGTSTMLHGIENIDDAFIVTARYKNDRVTRWADACVYQVDASTYRYVSWSVGDTQILAIKSTGDMSASATREYLFVVRYTKTTD